MTNDENPPGSDVRPRALDVGTAGATQNGLDVPTALAAVESAKALALAGRGTLLRVGSILSSDENSHDDVIVVLDYPVLREMKPGMVLILAKLAASPSMSA